MIKYLLSHDIGTSGNKATLFSTDGELIKSVTYAYDTKYFKGNWAEQNPEDWWKAVVFTTRTLLKEVNAKEIAAVAFSGQMMGCLCVDAAGVPLRNSIIWADMRSTAQAKALEEKIGREEFYRITGHRVSASYSLEKLMWLKDFEPDTYKAAYKMLQSKEYIIFKLTGAFCTEYSDASGTNILDLKAGVWSEKILNAAKVSPDKLPALLKSTDIAGTVTAKAAEETGLLKGTPVVMGGGDGQCAAVGAGCVKEGVAYNILGSSSWISIATKEPVYDDEMRTFNWAHIVPGYFGPCGTMQCAGGAYSWLKNNLGKYETEVAAAHGENPYKLIDEVAAASPPGANGVIFLPYLIGERSPRWNPEAKGAFLGLKMENTQADIFRSVMEGVSLNLNVILSIFKKYVKIEDMSLIGGGGKGALWRQIMADIYGLPVKRLKFLEEATSIGAAITGGVGVGALKGFDCVEEFNAVVETTYPDAKTRETYENRMRTFDAAYTALEPLFGGM